MRVHAVALLVAVLTVLGATFASPGMALQPTPDGRWFWQDPQPGGTWFSDVASVDGRSAWAVANDGVVLSTNDGGLTWRTQVSGTTADLEAVAAVDDLTAFAVGSFRVNDALSDTARVRIEVVDSSGTRRATMQLGNRRTSVTLAASFACRLPRGRYTFRVLAVDRAGNEQVRVGANSLRVL